MKSRQQSVLASLASSYAQFGKIGRGHTLPILHNGLNTKVQPTSISRRKSKVKFSIAQPTGPMSSMWYTMAPLVVLESLFSKEAEQGELINKHFILYMQQIPSSH